MTSNPPWSQPVCGACYLIRFKAICNVRATELRNTPEVCIDCGKETADGIYIDGRNPPKFRVTPAEKEAWRQELRLRGEPLPDDDEG